MSDLIPPHGGLKEPVNRNVHAEEAADFQARTAALPRLLISEADLSTLYRFGDGGLSPLTGPMDRETFDRVLDEEVIVQGGKKYAWTIPLSFPVDEEQAKTLKPSLWYVPTRSVGTREVRWSARWRSAIFFRGTRPIMSAASTAPSVSIIPAAG
jgi:ATP sulfurylase